MKNKKKFSWFKLFGNNRFVMVFSLICSFAIWVLLMYTNTDETQGWKVDNVPITVEYTTGAVEAGYKVYDTDRASVAVSISGSSLAVRQVQASDIEVVATINESVKPGSNTITLIARKKNDSLNNYVIENVDPGTITAEIDIAKESVFEIQNSISAVPEDNYYISLPQFSSDKVVVDGPESVVSKIASISAEYSFSDKLSDTKTFSAPLVMYDAEGEPINSDYVSLTMNEVDVKLPVLWKQGLNIVATFNNKPTMFPNRLISVSPVNNTFAGLKESFEKIKSITLDPIDFSKVNLSTNKFSADIITPDGLVNVDNTQKATVSFDLSGYGEKWINVEEVSLVNVPSNMTVTLSDESMRALAVGPSDDIGKLTEKNIVARINLSSVEITESGEVQLPVTVMIRDNNTCWIYGTYSVNADVTVD